VFRIPVLTESANRSKPAKEHPTSGPPSDWFADARLKQNGLRGVTFDFFL